MPGRRLSGMLHGALAFLATAAATGLVAFAAAALQVEAGTTVTPATSGFASGVCATLLVADAVGWFLLAQRARTALQEFGRNFNNSPTGGGSAIAAGGSATVYNINTGVTYNITVVQELTQIIEEGQDVYKRLSDPEETNEDALHEVFDHWHARVFSFFDSKMDSSYFTRMHEHSGMTSFAPTRLSWSQWRIRARADMDYDLRRLSEFLSDLHRMNA